MLPDGRQGVVGFLYLSESMDICCGILLETSMVVLLINALEETDMFRIGKPVVSQKSLVVN